MDFRRSGHDERRRRVLMDELSQPADSENAEAAPSPGSGSAKGPIRAYSAAVLEEKQPRVTDLVPIRPFWAALVILLAVTAVAAIETTHIFIRTTSVSSAAQLAALDAAQRGSVATWFAALVLACGAGLAIVTFGIRVHRVDDYRGRYRVWLWTAAALAWGSLDAATGIHDSLGLLLAQLAGQASVGGSLAAITTISWLAVYGLLLGTLAIRLAIEVWHSLPAFAALALAGICYLISILGVLEMLPQQGPLVDSVVTTTLILLAHVSLVSALALYARHVHLDATGRLKVHIDPDKRKTVKAKPKARLKVVKEDKTDKPADDKLAEKRAAAAAAVKPAASTAAKPAQPAAEKAKPAEGVKFGAAGPLASKVSASIAKPTSPSYEEDDVEDEDEDGQRLSRAERRKLKKLARRDDQRRAA